MKFSKLVVFIQCIDFPFPGYAIDSALGVRLVGGVNPSEGILQVFHGSMWCIVTLETINLPTVGVICHSLGFR